MAKAVSKQWEIAFFLNKLLYSRRFLGADVVFCKNTCRIFRKFWVTFTKLRTLIFNVPLMHSLESLVTLIKDFQKNETDVQTFIDQFQELYFNERVFERIPEKIQEPMDNIVLAVGLTVIDDEERDEFGPEIAPDRLKHIISENLSLVEAGI